CGPSRTCRSRGWHERSSVAPHQVDEDVFERRLRGVDVLETDAGRAELVEQRGDAGALAAGIVGVDQLSSVLAERQMVRGERGWHGVERLLQLQRELLLAELAHQLGLV